MSTILSLREIYAAKVSRILMYTLQACINLLFYLKNSLENRNPDQYKK